jgi:hypothetical protein
MKWTETGIARALAQQHFKRRYLCLVPNCTWTGHECDMLAVTEDLRIIDIEIKISRADLKADAKKEKWWYKSWNWIFEHDRQVGPPAPHVRLTHPPKVWKHYYAMPAEIWRDDLFDSLGSPDSGVLLLFGESDLLRIQVIRRAKPAKNAHVLTAAQAIDIARLASLRMWDSYAKLEAAMLRAEAA